MATTKIWTIKDSLKRVVNYAVNPGKTEIDDDLYAALHYAARPDKVTRLDEKKCFVTGVGCDAKTAYEEMMQVKEAFGKTSGNVAYHAYQSFKPGEITPEKCHDIGVALARKLWGSQYQVVVATHLDKEHCHNHYVINSVSYTTGRRFDCSERTYYRFRDASDTMCRERGLSVIEHPKGHTPRSIYFAEKRGEPTRYNLMRDAIDKAAAMSYTEREFYSALRKMGYVVEISERRKYPTIRSVNSKKATRMYHLGEEYTPEFIKERILMNHWDVRQNWYDFMYPQRDGSYYGGQNAWSSSLDRTLKGCSGIETVIVLFCYLIGILPAELPKQEHRKPLSPEMREACRRLDRYTEQIDLMAKHHFKTEADIGVFKMETQSQIDTLSRERRKLYDLVSRADTPDEKNSIRKDYEIYTGEIARLRRDLRTANRIIQDIPRMCECIEAERNMEAIHQQIESPSRNRKDRER